MQHVLGPGASLLLHLLPPMLQSKCTGSLQSAIVSWLHHKQTWTRWGRWLLNQMC
jgi:hypothetical protein